MNCPFCRLSVHPEAVICPHCHSNLGLVNSLSKKLGELESEVQRLKRHLGLDAPTGHEPAHRPTDTVSPRTDEGEAAETCHPPDLIPIGSARLITGVITGAMSVWALQAVTLFAYDLPPVILRTLALVAPFFIAMLFYRRVRFEFSSLALPAIVVALSSVCLMLAMTAYVDNVPMWPETSRDWRELLEFVAAIALGYAAGGLLAKSLDRSRPRSPGPPFIVLLLRRDEKGRYNVEALADRIHAFTSAFAPLATGALSLYSGLRTLVGGS